MGTEVVSITRCRGMCDLCNRFTWVNAQAIDGIVVAMQCNRCEKDK